VLNQTETKPEVMFILILFGPPGAGKGTQAKKIAVKFDWVHISTGEILRSEVSKGTPLGLKVKTVMGSGHLVSDELLIQIMESVFQDHRNAKGFVLDGFPRTLNQASELDLMLRKHGHKVSLVLSLEVDEDELVKRLVNRELELHRQDDTGDVIKNRIVQYHQHTQPLIEYYKTNGLLKTVFGVGGIEEIFENLCRVIQSGQKFPIPS
jgi:adenylate kinase